MSGLTRPSPPAELTGPRLEKPITSFELSAPLVAAAQPSVPVWRTFSPAPTQITFFAVAGLLTVLAPEPSFPAANTTVISCRPAVAVWASRTILSYACALVSYRRAAAPVNPHELLDMRALWP